MEGMENNMETVFRQALANHETEVSAKVWAGVKAKIASQVLGSASHAAQGGFFSNAASIIAISTIVGIGSINEVALYHSSQPEVFTESHLSDQSIDQPEQIKVDQHSVVLSETDEIVTPQQADASHVPAQFQATGKIVNPSEFNEPASPAKDGNVELNKTSSSLSTAPNDSEAIQQSPITQTPVAPTPEIPAIPELANKSVENPVCAIRLNHAAKAFISPDGDGTNDYFSVETSQEVSNFFIRIFTQQGKLVFESNDINFRWNGTDERGNILPNHTVCYYQINAFDQNGTPYSAKNTKGSITIFH